jgi:hypothetical protein
MPKLYTWEQTQSEVRVFVPVPQDFNFKRDVKYLLLIAALRCSIESVDH